MEKRALIISNSAGLITSFLKNDVEILSDKGFKIVCACNMDYKHSNTDAFFKKYEIEVIDVKFPIRSLNYSKIVSAYRSVNDILSKNHFELVHCHSTIAAVIGRSCAKRYRKKGTKICYTSHGLPFYEGNNGLKAKVFKCIENYYSKYTDVIFSICEEDFINLKKMKCINVFWMKGVGVEIDKFEHCSVDISEYRENLGVNNDDLMVLSVGELNSNKNHQVVIKALSMINKPNIVYVICGRELTEVGKKAELADLAKELNVNLILLGFRTDIPEICKCADIGALPSFKEGLGLSGIEMLATGLPVVGSNRQGIKDYVVNDITGYLADPTSVASFAEAIIKCLQMKKQKDCKARCINMSKQFSMQQAREVILSGYSKVGI